MAPFAVLLMLATPLQDSGTAGATAPPRLTQAPAPPHTDGPAMAEVFRQVAVNWDLSCETPRFADHRIAFDVTLDSRGRITEGPTVVRPRNDPVWRAAADSARVALIRTSPFDVPEGFAGGRYRPIFDAARACARATEADED